MKTSRWPAARGVGALALFVVAGTGCEWSSIAAPNAGAGGGSSSTAATTTTTSASSSSSSSASTGSASGGGGAGGSAACADDPVAPEETLPDTTDPEQGMFTMTQALDGLPPGPGPLRAIITTELGTLTCAMRDDLAPISVANFVGLARGRRAFYDTTQAAWVRRRFYDGLTWHRVIPMFVAQGGDPLGTGFGGPGYTIQDEFTTGLMHDPGAMAYANTGQPNSGGSQFYVVAETPVHFLDGHYSVFGLCDPVSVVTALTDVPRDGNDKPLTPIHMTTVVVTRCAP